MYSYFSDEDIKVLDWVGLKRFIDVYCETYKKDNEWWVVEKVISKMIRKRESEEYFTFGDWSDIKLISYWYDYQLIFLQGIAPFIEGRVSWDFESDDECGSLEFKNGECKITTGVMSYHNWKPMDNLREKDIPSELKTQLVLDKLNQRTK